MLNKYLKNSIISFILITSTVLTPLAFVPKKANAQQGITGYISGSSTVIAQLPLCVGKVTSSFKTLFPSKTELLDMGTDTVTNFIDEELQLESWMSDFGEDKIPVDIGEKNTQNIEDTKKNSVETNKIVKSIEANDTCLKSIGRVVIKMLLQKITLSTVEWINNGYNGSPMFIQNPGDFFKDIAKNEILQFNLEISDPNLFPFGKTWMQNQAIAFNQKFANNAQYSLNQLIKQTSPEFSAQSFNLDFSKGGWNAWNAMTQIPANNPLGFSLMASNELQQRLAGTTQSTAQNLRDSLQQASGYLGSERCVEPSNDITREEHNNALNRVDGARLCTRWEYVTPGQMVADAATKTINYPDNNLLKAEDLNDAVAAILDAMLSKFSTDLMGKSGFAGLSSSIDFQQASEGDFIINNDSLEINTNFQDFPGYQVAGSSFLSQNPNFNIRKDLNQAVIDEQRIFLDKLIEQNTELKSTIPLNKTNNPDGNFTGNYGLIPTIYQLDYCIPGPHPGYEIDSRNIFNAALDTVVPETEESLSNRNLKDIVAVSSTLIGLGAAAAGAAIGATIGSGVPVIGTIIGAAVGTLVGVISTMATSRNDERNLRTYYGIVLTSFTGLKITVGEKPNDYKQASNLYSKQQVVGVLNTVLDRYIKIIKETYKPEFMPSVTKEAAIKYGQQKGYIQMYKNNETKIIGMKSVILRLGEIKNNIERLNNELSAGIINQAQYEENLKPWISAFGRLSVDMVSGDDIAIVDNRIKQIVDEKDYIYNILLKGPTGCEKDIESNKGASGVSGLWGTRDEALYRGVRTTKRMTYPGELLYDYNNYKGGETLPDPYKSGAINTMPADDFVNTLGPGFLSWVWFDSRGGESVKDHGCTTYTQWFGGCLKISDIIPVQNGASAPIGFNPKTKTGIFESMIGVY
jgi:hypothetical protein